ncbi:hypothetical protein Q7A53_07595 [Halobacillus rhizosphaerae]|uniref:hypothetical protein n=1 Tax=Halobacillus rhizosphaerae TaxID=3064889 RepID=UPI00398A69E8
MNIWIGIIVTVSFVYLYRRYLPVPGVNPINIYEENESLEGLVIVDTRDYQTSSRDKIPSAYCMPLPYLNRHYNELPDQGIIIFAADYVEKNLSARILRSKGKCIAGYCLAGNLERNDRIGIQ